MIEIVIALALGTIVTGLVLSLFVVSFATWRRGSDIRQAQVQAAGIVDLISRDVRAGSQIAGSVRPALEVESGVVVLALRRTSLKEPGSGGDEDLPWVLYVFDQERQELRRALAAFTRDDRLEVHESGIVGTGVRRVAITNLNAGITIDVEVRRGRSSARMRGAAAPQNP